MVGRIRVYFEGDHTLKQGFHEFFSEIVGRARELRCRINFISAGATPVEDYRTALAKHPDAWNVLLLDSDAPFSSNLFLLKGLDESWAQSVFWMVQIMEAWFLADLDAIERYYGSNFRASPLRGNPRIEEIPKGRIYESLRAATRETAKGEYHKTKHASSLLLAISPDRVRQACPNCQRLFDVVLGRLAG